jgi:hypothetical protein
MRAYKREGKFGFGLTVSLDECVVKGVGELSVTSVSKLSATEREKHVLPPWMDG